MSPNKSNLTNATSAEGFTRAADDWCHLAPLGEFPAGATAKVQVIDTLAVACMVRDFKNRASSPGFPGVLVDFDHLSANPETESRAAGWITDLAARPDGLWASIRWTSSGLAAVAGGDYRYLSPVFTGDVLEDMGVNRFMPRVLESAAMTNQPALTGLKPLTSVAPVRNRGLAPASPDLAEARAVFNRKVETTRKAKGCTFARAYEQTMLDEPALFNRAWKSAV